MIAAGSLALFLIFGNLLLGSRTASGGSPAVRDCLRAIHR